MNTDKHRRITRDLSLNQNELDMEAVSESNYDQDDRQGEETPVSKDEAKRKSELSQSVALSALLSDTASLRKVKGTRLSSIDRNMPQNASPFELTKSNQALEDIKDLDSQNSKLQEEIEQRKKRISEFGGVGHGNDLTTVREATNSYDETSQKMDNELSGTYMKLDSDPHILTPHEIEATFEKHFKSWKFNEIEDTSKALLHDLKKAMGHIPDSEESIDAVDDGQSSVLNEISEIPTNVDEILDLYDAKKWVTNYKDLIRIERKFEQGRLEKLKYLGVEDRYDRVSKFVEEMYFQIRIQCWGAKVDVKIDTFKSKDFSIELKFKHNMHFKLYLRCKDGSIGWIDYELLDVEILSCPDGYLSDIEYFIRDSQEACDWMKFIRNLRQIPALIYMNESTPIH